MHRLTLSELSRQLQNGDITSRQLTEHFLSRINQYDGNINSYTTATEQQALAQADHADRLLQQNQGGPLTGIPFAHKDIFCTEGIKTACGSKMLDNFVPPYDATVTHYLQQAGAVLLGKTNMDEFAMGSSNENSYYGPVSNPWDNQRVPGGSSGGSAAAVAAGLAPVATGTDTGGSIRQPAALCGVSGIKPTYGRVSRFGMIAFASSLDQGGVIGKTAECLARMLQPMAQPDGKDSTCFTQPPEDYLQTIERPMDNLTIGVPSEFFESDMEQGVTDCVNQAIEDLQSMGATVKSVSLPHTEAALSAYYIIAPAECSSNLARYDGVRYGHRCNEPQDLQDLYKRSRSEGLGDEVKRRIMTGTYALSAGYYDAYYLKAQKIRQLVKQDYVQAFNDVDCIVAPTTPATAFEQGEKTQDPVAMYLSDMFTIPVNLAGLPALSLPCGFNNGLPVGMQLIGTYFDEGRLLNIAHQYQQQTQWHQYFPEEYN